MEKRHDGWTITGIVVIAVLVAAWSIYSQVKLAELAEVPGGLRIVLPVSTDAAAAVATRVYLDTRYNNKAKKYAGAIAMLAATVSVVLASVQHVLPVKNLDGTPYLAPEWLKLVIGGFPTICFVLIVHLAAMLPRSRRKADVQTTATVAVSSPPATVAVPSSEAPAPAAATEPQPEPKEKAPRPIRKAAPSKGASLHLVPTDRPGWLTDDMNAKQAMFAFFDHHPDATGADADRFGAQHLETKPTLGRRVRKEWAQARDRRAASGE